MDIAKLYSLLEEVRGCTFASIDTRTEPSLGISKVVTNEVVLLCSNVGHSVYERMVKKRLKEIGKDPDAFSVAPLPFGERIGQTSIIEHKGKYYLQTLLIKAGHVEAFIGKTPVNPSELGDLIVRDSAIRDSAARQGVPQDKAVIVRTYKLESVTSIRLQNTRIDG